MAESAYLGVDIGSKRLKIAVIDDSGNVRQVISEDISDLLVRPRPTWAERDPLKLWARIVRAFQKLDSSGRVEAICIDGTSGTIVPVDEKLKPLFPLMLYSDLRARKEADELRKKSPTAKNYEVFLPIAPYLVVPKIMWLKKNMLDFTKVSAILHENDFFSAILTGEIATSSNTAGKSHVDVRTREYLKEVYEEVGINIDLMPPIKPIGREIGQLKEEIAELIGVQAGIPVFNGVTDSSAGDISTGTLKPGQTNVTIGTTLVVHAVVDRPVPDPKKRIYYKTYVERAFLTGGATNAGTISMDAIAALVGKTVEELNMEAEEVPAGCEGIIAQPQWMGARVPENNPNVRGFFIGITEKNFKGPYLYRAVLEGNAFVLREVLEIIEEVTDTSIKEIRACGGGSRSKLLNQIIADVTQVRVRIVKESEPAIGSAMIAASSWKKEPISTIAENVVRETGVFDPSTEKISTYERNYKIFKEITRSMIEIYDLHAISID